MKNPLSPVPTGLLLALAIPLSSAAITAQTLSHVVLPSGTAGTDANGSNTLPWGRAAAGPARVQMLYDTSHFTAQGVNQPILIRSLRWRANGAAANWTGGSYATVSVALSSSPRNASSPSNTWTANQGADYSIVHSGPVAFLGGSATNGSLGPIVVDLSLPSPFFYDPTLGNDLLIDVDMPPGQWLSGTTTATDALTTAPGTGRVSATATYGGATGTITQNAQALVVDVGYQPVNGVIADFTASTTAGPSPLAVTFTDTSFTSDPGGITQWSWDLDGDGLIDSTLRNPTFQYTACGDYSVTLHVTAANGSATRTVQNMIVTDEFAPSFSVQNVAPGTFLFADTSTPPGTSWAWDFDGDQVVDSTSGPAVIHTYPTTCVAADVSLGVSRNCRGPLQVKRQVVASPGQIATTQQGGTVSSGTGFFWPGVLFDITVTNPQGISICAVSLPMRTGSGFIDMDFDVVAGSHVGRDTTPADWYLAAFGFGAVQNSATSGVTLSTIPLSQPVYLAPGNYGISIWINDFVGNLADLITTTGGTQTYVNGDLLVNPNPISAPGIARDDWFSGNALTNQSINVMLHYSQVGTTAEPGLGYFASGCAGSANACRVSASSLPSLGGTLAIDFWDLPYDLALTTIGFSRTVSSLGPLPIDLGPVGAPGCHLRVPLDITNVLVGQFSFGTWSMAVPNQPSLLGAQFFAQGFPYDPVANGLGLVTSHAVAGILGF